MDPLAEKYPNVSSYVYCHNNPVNMVDPDGRGDYFNKETGVSSGNDGINDDKTYAADAVKKNDKGIVIDATNKVDLKVTSEAFLFMAQTLYAESSNKTSKEEVSGIYSALENRAEAYDTDVKSQMKVGYPCGVYGSSKEHRDRYNTEKGAGPADKRNIVRAGLILGIISDYDYSQGAFFWDGTDFKAGGGHQERYVPGYLFTDQSHDIYEMGNNSKPGKTKYGSWSYKYQSTTVINHTTFSKITDSWLDAQYSGVKKARPLGN